MCRCYVTFGKMPLFKVVVNIIFLSVWAASNASLYNGCQPFHVAFIHKRKKTTDINLHTTNFIQWHLQENTEYDENGSKKTFLVRVFSIINWTFSTFFRHIFLGQKLISWELKSVLCIRQKFFYDEKYFAWKAQIYGKNTVFVKWICVKFYCYLGHAGKKHSNFF